ncbi:hypothetical protein GWI33_000370 [Rhynchophorus ferrugineus]|uniref:Uncharacterized protein n=1 Tax=Rhynchophorus ferrugineus TaxID=354439 RepID=A0A834HN98_RHYFE|nr:hypothetical protein GWI33_000370 [Rhynchophorus ferrugineus]
MYIFIFLLQIFCRKSHERKQHQFQHYCNSGPSPNFLGHTPDCDLERLSEKYWGEILERTLSSSSLHALQRACSPPRLDCNGGIELKIMDATVPDL